MAELSFAKLCMAIFESLGIMSLFWLIQIILVNRIFSKSPYLRHFSAFILLSLGTLLFILQLVTGDISVIFSENTGLFPIDFLLRKIPISWINLGVVVTGLLYAIGFSFHVSLFIHSMLEGSTKDLPYSIPGKWDYTLQQLQRKLGIRKTIRLFTIDGTGSPSTFGVFQPVILLPLATINSLTISEMESILMHELAHIKRQDWLMCLITRCLGIILFFNPFAQRLCRIIAEEAEMACDQLVVRHHAQPVIYAGALLSIAQSGSKIRVNLAAIGNRDNLLKRIKLIVRSGNNLLPRPSGMEIGIALLILFFSLILMPTYQKSFKNTEYKLAARNSTQKSSESVSSQRNIRKIVNPVKKRDPLTNNVQRKSYGIFNNKLLSKKMDDKKVSVLIDTIKKVNQEYGKDQSDITVSTLPKSLPPDPRDRRHISILRTTDLSMQSFGEDFMDEFILLIEDPHLRNLLKNQEMIIPLPNGKIPFNIKEK